MTDDIIMCFYILYPVIFFMIYFLYKMICEGINIIDGVVIAALITSTASLIGIVVQIYCSRRNDEKRFDSLDNELHNKHTLEKAKIYHNELQKEILETRKDIIYRTDNTKEMITSNLDHISNYIEQYQQNILLASSQNMNIKGVLETIEGVIQENGILKRNNRDLIKENIVLKKEIEILKRENKELQQTASQNKEHDIDDYSLSR